MMEQLIAERRANLEASVKRALKQMQTDGLAVQLELHQTSSQFAPNRLCEVLRDQIEAGREKLIQKLLHEIDNTIFERDKVELKHQRLKLQLSTRHQEIQLESKRLTQTKEATSQRIRELQKKHSQTLDRFQKALTARDCQIANFRQILTKSKIFLESFSTELSEVRAAIELLSVQTSRVFRSAIQDLRQIAGRSLSHRKGMIQQRASKQISSKQSSIATTKAKCATIRDSLQSLKTFINDIAASNSINTRFSESNPALLRDVLSSVIIAEENAAIKQQFRGSSPSRGSDSTPTFYVQSLRENYEKALQNKERDLDEIIAQARQRRLNLQIELDAALEQIRRLQGSKASDTDLTRHFEQTRYDFESSTRQLDATMSQLGLRPRSRVSSSFV
jgi:chromosome segregation ATPase